MISANLLDGVFRRTLFQLVKAVAPFLDELMIVEVFLDDHVDHAEGECRVGAGADLQEEVGLLGNLAEAGVDDDELRAALLHVAQGPLPIQKLGSCGLRPHKTTRSARFQSDLSEQKPP